jgi:hypothetical protein
MKDTTPQVRLHHYFFVQFRLFNFFKDRQDRISFILDNFHYDDMQHTLEILWLQAYTQNRNIIPKNKKMECVGLSSVLEKIDKNRQIILITLPTPQALTESYYVAVYIRTIENTDSAELRYFTLEYHDEEKSAICELSQGGHTLHGIVKNLDKEKFIEIVKNIVEEDV